MNNTIKIRREDPCQRRDFLILKSWSGALLGLLSVLSTLFALTKLLPTIYSSSCHIEGSWNLSRYPGATFALIESLASLTFLVMLLQAAFLTFTLDYVPRLFLRTIPHSLKQCNGRISALWNSKQAWVPNNFESFDDNNSTSHSGLSINDYDCS